MSGPAPAHAQPGDAQPGDAANGPRHYPTLASLAGEVGRSLGTSPWVLIDQDRIDRFAAATDDAQWIHVDPQRAAAEGRYGGTVAHGFLTLSLLASMLEAALRIDDRRYALNYGLNRVRFPAPVPAGRRVRGHLRLLAYEPIDGGAQLSIEVQVEAEGLAKPVCVAESLTRHYL